ncbi:MAG: preprotein translocase subunit YajC [Clostridia bacterium]|nr:preprotein translocase subunit YajC [Clostridia bacterium]
MLFNLLSASATTSSGTGTGGSTWGTWLMVGILVLILVVFMVYNRRTQKKRQQETMDMLDAIKPGNKVKTIGGICGVVVEICDDGTFVLETGTEASGKAYIKFDKQAVYQTDAVVEKKAPEAKSETEAPADEAAAETPAEETPAEEKTSDEQ